MSRKHPFQTSGNSARPGAFTLLELLIVIAIIGILASMILTAVAKAQAAARGTYCLNNTKQLSYAWLMYADDHNQGLAYNFGGPAARSVANWAAGVLDWELTSDNTNTAMLTGSALAPNISSVYTSYRCPSDLSLSQIQRSAGWQNRVRSYSMNASVGNAGSISQSGVNTNNPGYVQFFKLVSIPAPSRIFVFLDEHPDSISDGYFVNHAQSPGYYPDPQWTRLPASYHNGGANFSFADGHAEYHRWHSATTVLPPTPDIIPSQMDADPVDFAWVIDRMSVLNGQAVPYSY